MNNFEDMSVVNSKLCDTCLNQEYKSNIIQSFDKIITSIETRIHVLKDVETQLINFTRSELRLMKIRSSRIIDKRLNTSSEFSKPFMITKDIAEFTGWDINDKKSRIDITKALCNYIKENNLQNEKDKRQILPDDKLGKLLNYDPNTESEPLTYFRLQSWLKNHLNV